jgi:hypothetical protein
MTAGYSVTPLPQKLGIKPASRVMLLGAPEGFSATLGTLPADVRVVTTLRGSADVLVCFTVEQAVLERRIEAIGQAIFPDGGAWIAWPKRASKVPTDMTEDVVRAVALPLGLVDNKVAAIDETWSGLRLAWRRTSRG